MDRIGRNVVPGQQLIFPRAGIIIEANEAVRPGQYALVVQEGEVLESKLLGDLLQKKPQVSGTGATARLLFEQIGKARSATSLRHIRHRGDAIGTPCSVSAAPGASLAQCRATLVEH